MNHILLIDDDCKLFGLLRDYFRRYELKLSGKQHPAEGIQAIREQSFDLVILDLMLPDMDGFDVCREIRKFSSVPILMLTARGDLTDRIAGLELGADDYLAKPFEPRELVVRIKAVLRRSQHVSAQATHYRFEGLSIDCQRQEALLDGTLLELTSMEYKLLVFLASNPQTTLSRDDILNYLRGLDSSVYSRAIDIGISRLRQKLGDKKRPYRFIKTIWGAGYRFIGQSLQ